MTNTTRFNRRELVQLALVMGGGAMAAQVVWKFAARRSRPAQITVDGRTAHVLTAEEWHTLAAVQDRILPSSAGSPGASDVNATGYTDSALAEPSASKDDLETLRTGLARLDAMARQTGGAGFHTLSATGRDDTLKQFQTQDDDGPIWMGLVVVFTLEALLGDPVYGGNTNQAGWSWLDHTPGFPRPPSPWPERLA